jgi:hypothetical protein
MSAKIVRQLIKGSAEINRMQSEIHLVINILLSALRDSVLLSQGPVKIVSVQESPIEFVWKIQRAMGGKMVAECFLRNDTLACGLSLSYTSSKGSGSIAIRQVQKTYDTLPHLIEKAMETFNLLEWELRPFLNAAATKQ